MKCLYLEYNVSEDYKATYFNSDIPDKGLYHFFELPGKDRKCKPYIFNLTHYGFIPDSATTLSLIATFNIYAKNNPNKIVSSVVFNTKTNRDGIFLPGTYYSPDGSKLIVDNTSIRKFYLRVN